MRDNAKKMKRVGMVWLHSKDLLIKHLGFSQATGLVMLNCKGKGLWDRHGD